MTAPADRISRIFHEAVARPPEERLAFVAEACEGDEALRQELESLLAVDGADGEFLERPAAEALAGDSPVADLVGQAWGAYTILAPLGAGGMGEVYRAHDARLDRDVALKVLRSEVSADPERRARLAREARSLAALSHPNIGAIYGLEERDGAVALILELVEGPTLAERLEHGPLPVLEALAVAHQIAEGLQAAHDKGFVHRDLKPTNIVLQKSPEGTPHAKVLDFGLAKALAGEAPKTMTDTTEGRILGTPAYMSPEQARGLPVDRRTDIWAFGCVLFEMLCGLQPFEGATVTDTLARILDREPDWSALPRHTPDSVRRLLERCLRKEPHRRLHDIGDALIELDDATPQLRGQPVPAALRSRSGWLLWLAGAVILVLAGALLTRPRPAATESVVFAVPPSQGSRFTNPPFFAISPDGRHLAWKEFTNGASRVWVRAIGSPDARSLPETDGAFGLFWRPDSRTIGYFAGGLLKTVSLDGGSPLTLGHGDTAIWTGGSWNERDDVLFNSGCCLWHVKAVPAAPPPRQLTKTVGDEIDHMWPAFLPDGDHFLYLVTRETTHENEVRVGSLSSPETRSLGMFESHVAYAGGYLFYVRRGNLTAQAFDPASLRLDGEPWLLDVRAGVDPVWQRGIFSVTPTALAYRAVAGPPLALTWVNRDGKVLETVGEPAYVYNLNLSVDGSRIAVSRLTELPLAPAQTDIWTLDQAGRPAHRLTDERGWEWDPVWSPDGRQIAFTSNRDRRRRFLHSLYVAPSNGTGEPQVLDASNAAGPDWSPNGRHIIYNRFSETTSEDIWTIDLAGDRMPRPFLNTPSHESGAVFSPDSRWVAYVSMVTGRREVYLRRFPAGADAIRVSTDSGALPRWRGDGKELFFVGRGAMMAVDVDFTRESVGRPHVLFQPTVGQSCCSTYAVARDGQRFLIPSPLSEPPITVVLNWKARLHADASPTRTPPDGGAR